MDTPSVPINFVPVQEGEVLDFPGGVKCRIMEDGSRTDNRIGAAEFTIPANSQGPPPHWHEMHDETFLVTAGTIRFHAKDGKHIDAKTGDYVTIPPRAPHTFSNPSDEEARFFNTLTPAYYINYFKLMDQWRKTGVKLDAESVKKAMAYFATIGVEGAL